VSREKEAEKRAFDYFQSGYHCAESILKTIVELHTEEEAQGKEIPKIASSFCGGIGGTHEDVCGALTGGVIAIGFLCGRMKPGEDIQNAKALASGFRKQFIKEFGSTNCGKILERLGQQENSLKCKKLTATAARLLSERLSSHFSSN
jgi:C_GCAxxG_C_C family probable redox protein